MSNETRTSEASKKEAMQILKAEMEAMRLTGLMMELGVKNTHPGLFDRYSNAVDAINDTEDDYVPTDAQVQAVIELQSEVREVIEKATGKPSDFPQ